MTDGMCTTAKRLPLGLPRPQADMANDLVPRADLNVLQPEQFLLQTPALDWTFGGVFPVSIPEDEDRCQQ